MNNQERVKFKITKQHIQGAIAMLLVCILAVSALVLTPGVNLFGTLADLSEDSENAIFNEVPENEGVSEDGDIYEDGYAVDETASAPEAVTIIGFADTPYTDPESGGDFITIDEGTPLSNIPLPKTLAATVAGNLSDGGNEADYTVNIDRWECAEKLDEETAMPVPGGYDSMIPGTYIFAPILDLRENEHLASGVTVPTVDVVVSMNLPVLGTEVIELPRFDGGDGSSLYPYLINTAEQLKQAAELINDGRSGVYNTAHYRLTADIDLSSLQDEWIPIGGNDSLTMFRGSFDGNFHVITGLVNNSGADYVGLFGYIKAPTLVLGGASVRNLGIKDAEITGNNHAGILAGGLGNNVEISNCWVSGEVSGRRYIGGLVGSIDVNDGSHSSISNSYSTATVSGSAEYAGGVVGYIHYGSVTNCYSTGTVSGYYRPGGVTGMVESRSSVTYCAALGASVEKASRDDRIGRITPSIGLYSPVLEGNAAFEGMLKICNTDTEWVNTGAENLDGVSITATAIAGDGTIGGRFRSPSWKTVNGKMPILAGFEPGAQPDTVPPHLLPEASLFKGAGTNSNPYLIETPQQLAKLAQLVNDSPTFYNAPGTCYRLANDVSLADYQTGVGWTPIGNASYSFKGNFDGSGFVINGLEINNASINRAGLFGWVEGGIVENLGIPDARINSGTAVGGVVGLLSGDGTIRNCYVTGQISGASNVGGITGSVNRSNVKNCYVSASVSGTGSNIGGIAGTSSGNVSNCYSTADVSGINYVGGVVGNATGGSIKECAALSASIKGTSRGTYTGRIVGQITGTLSGNVAYSGIVNNSNTTAWSNKGAANVDGADITTADITGDIGGIFATPDWTTGEDTMPILTGIGGQSGEKPPHLKP